ncbi:MAG: hypothetical protein COA96_12835 [SAR86 cluster bacterium]|uniref:Uncharacterized protein n=1 Tax=SAR86 cluster bacterium TaxID=2030880 RepID=A0A2A5AUJ6_9GAMM|nr:MAG: hypothetical protein COA96_12835 [SAR86 cluster bacterium]
MKRNIRSTIDAVLTGLGIGVIFSAVLLATTVTVQIQMFIALFGVLLMEAGIWGLSSKVFPNERRFISLRSEGDNIIGLIRELNSAALARDTGSEDDKRFQATLEKMHSSVKRMSELASEEGKSTSTK